MILSDITMPKGNHIIKKTAHGVAVFLMIFYQIQAVAFNYLIKLMYTDTDK